MGIGTWLAAMMAPLTARILLALGFQVVTITGVAASMTALKNLFISQVGGVPAAGFQMLLLGGFGEVVGILFGAAAFKLALWQIQQSTKILGVGA